MLSGLASDVKGDCADQYKRGDSDTKMVVSITEVAFIHVCGQF